MKKQKHGFWVFIFSLIPGAGEMYMGFKNQGISIMLLFWGSIALASITGLGWQKKNFTLLMTITFFTWISFPVIWESSSRSTEM